MNVRAMTVFFWGFLVASAAIASEEYRSEIKTAVESDDGRDVTITRTADGLEVNVGGETIAMPRDRHHKAVNMTKKIRVIKTEDTDGVTVISSDEIDAETRAKIEAAFREAGKDGKVIFLDGSGPGDGELVHGRHEVIIKKEIETTTN